MFYITEDTFGKKLTEKSQIRKNMICNLIEGNKHKEIIKKIFNTYDKGEFKYILENELFYEKIAEKLLVRLYEGIKNNKITIDDFTDVYIRIGKKGFFQTVLLLKL